VFPYNVLARTGAGALLDSAQRHEAGVIATQPLHHGLLGGAHGWSRDTRFARGDWRNDRYADLTEHLAKLDAIAKAGPLLKQETDSLADLALRFVLRRAEISVVAPSIRTRDQLDVLLRAADGRGLSKSLVERLTEEL
jgi:aryl-alcohol dehydrogenase-like predicted oxidoreductase